MTKIIAIRKSFPSKQWYIKQIVEFETWWSKNLATVISDQHWHTIWLMIYEPPRGNMSEKLVKFEISCDYRRDNLEDTKKDAAEIRNKLNGENPILYIHPQINNYVSFGSIVGNPYVISTDIPFQPEDVEYIEDSLMYESSSRRIPPEYPNDPGDYLRPLDIVKVKKSKAGNDYYHFGIYMGNKQICHFSDPYSKKSTDNMRVRITSWEDFISGWVYSINGSIVRIHPVVPFRNYREIAKNIAWDEINKHGDGKYCLANNNCEHYVNSRIFGLNYSKQVEERSGKARENSHRQGIWEWGPKCYECKQGRINNGKSGNFVLRDELNNSNFNSKREDSAYREIVNQYTQEVPPKSAGYYS